MRYLLLYCTALERIPFRHAAENADAAAVLAGKLDKAQHQVRSQSQTRTPLRTRDPLVGRELQHSLVSHAEAFMKGVHPSNMDMRLDSSAAAA